MKTDPLFYIIIVLLLTIIGLFGYATYLEVSANSKSLSQINDNISALNDKFDNGLTITITD